MDNNLYDPVQVAHMEINGRNIWTFLFRTTIGDYYLTEHECPGKEILEDYIGRYEDKAAQAFKRIATKMIHGKA